MCNPAVTPPLQLVKGDCFYQLLFEITDLYLRKTSGEKGNRHVFMVKIPNKRVRSK